MDSDSRMDPVASDDHLGGSDDRDVGNGWDRHVRRLRRLGAFLRSIVLRVYRSRTAAWVMAIIVVASGFWRVETTQNELHAEVRRRALFECEATNTDVRNTERALEILVRRMGAATGSDPELVDQFITDVSAELRHEMPLHDCAVTQTNGGGRAGER